MRKLKRNNEIQSFYLMFLVPSYINNMQINNKDNRITNKLIIIIINKLRVLCEFYIFFQILSPRSCQMLNCLANVKL